MKTRRTKRIPRLDEFCHGCGKTPATYAAVTDCPLCDACLEIESDPVKQAAAIAAVQG